MAGGDYARWGLATEVEEWGYGIPGADEVYDALFHSMPAIEWNRIGVFQDVTMRLIAEAALPEGQHGHVYVQGELTRQPTPKLPPPGAGKRYHLFCSPENMGAVQLASEVQGALGAEVLVSQDEAEMALCDHFLVYLSSQTWTRGEASRAFATQVELSMSLTGAKPRLLLAHEMLGLENSQDAV